MNVEFVECLVKLRFVIGYLGEKEQLGWWQSSFFTQGNKAFLAPLFTKTQILAQCNGVTRAATLVHDERIGVGHVFHLFRLPEEIEQGIHKALHNTALCLELLKLVNNEDSAFAYLRKSGVDADLIDEGPKIVGGIDTLYDCQAWLNVTSIYRIGFEQNTQVFPYFIGKE